MNLIAKLPTDAEVRRVRELADLGWKTSRIALDVFGTPHGRPLRLIAAIRRDPDRFDSYVDEVAVERVLDGDPRVWPHMTYAERLEVMRRASARRVQEIAEGKADADAPSEWFERCAKAAGFGSSEHFRGMANAMARRGKA